MSALVMAVLGVLFILSGFLLMLSISSKIQIILVISVFCVGILLVSLAMLLWRMPALFESKPGRRPEPPARP